MDYYNQYIPNEFKIIKTSQTCFSFKGFDLFKIVVVFSLADIESDMRLISRWRLYASEFEFENVPTRSRHFLRYLKYFSTKSRFILIFLFLNKI